MRVKRRYKIAFDDDDESKVKLYTYEELIYDFETLEGGELTSAYISTDARVREFGTLRAATIKRVPYAAVFSRFTKLPITAVSCIHPLDF